MRERRLFRFHQEQFAVNPIDDITMMTLASLEKDKIMQAISALAGREVVSINFRTTLLQYLQLCRSAGIQFKYCLSDRLTQCLVCLQHAPVSFERFQCSCLKLQFRYIQDCTCVCGIGLVCVCDDLPLMCYDLDVLADIVSVTWRQFLDHFIRTYHSFTNLVAAQPLEGEFCEERTRNVSTVCRFVQYEPP